MRIRMACLLFLAFLNSIRCSPLSAGVLDPGLATRLASSATRFVDVIVVFRSSPDIGAPRSTGDSRARHQSLLLQYLEDARRTRQDCEAFLDGHTDEWTRRQPLWIVNGLAIEASGPLVRRLVARPDVEAVYEDAPVSLLPATETRIPKSDQRALDAAGSGVAAEPTPTYGLSRVKAPEAWRLHGLSGRGVRVGVLDTGVDAGHADLKGKVERWKDFVNQRRDPYDDQGHGTHVCGTIAGGATSGLAIGVAPDSRLTVAKVFSASGSGPTSVLLAAMEWIADPDGDPSTDDQPAICSNSWGGDTVSSVFRGAVRRWVALDIFPCFAAGNSGPAAGTVGIPGGYPESLAVGATDSTDAIASFSSRGPASWDGHEIVKPNVSAPGKDVTSAKVGGGYLSLSGTSMATPHVAGLLALLYQANPRMPVSQARGLVEISTDDLGEPGLDNSFGTGRANAANAAQALMAGGRLAGHLRDAAGGGGLRGIVTVLELGARVRTAPGTGGYELRLPPARYTLNARAFGYRNLDGIPLEILPGQTSNVELSLERAQTGTLSGLVVASGTGEPLKATVGVLDTPLDLVATSETGVFSLSLPQGKYSVAVVATGYDPLRVDGVEVRAGHTTSLPARLQHVPPILLVADDEGKGYDRYLRAALDALGKRYSVLDPRQLPGLLTGQFLAQYDVVLWMTGDAFDDTLTGDDQRALLWYLGTGGRLVVTGQEIGFDLKGTDFYRKILHARFVDDYTPAREVGGSGLSFRIDGGTGADNQRYPDRIEIDGGGREVFRYAGGQGPAGVEGDAERGRCIYLPFGFEGIDTADHRREALNVILERLSPRLSERAARLKAVIDVAETDAPITALLDALTGELVRDVRDMDSTRLRKELRLDGGGNPWSRTVRRAALERLRGAPR